MTSQAHNAVHIEKEGHDTAYSPSNLSSRFHLSKIVDIMYFYEESHIEAEQPVVLKRLLLQEI